MDDEISNSFVLSFFLFTVEAVVDSMLRLVNVLLEYGLSGHAARDC
jgi:hypothetical protein